MDETRLVEAVEQGTNSRACFLFGCATAPAVRIVGVAEESEYCADHAAQLVLELLALPSVQEALAKRQRTVMVLGPWELAILRPLLEWADAALRGLNDKIAGK